MMSVADLARYRFESDFDGAFESAVRAEYCQ